MIDELFAGWHGIIGIFGIIGTSHDNPENPRNPRNPTSKLKPRAGDEESGAVSDRDGKSPEIDEKGSQD